MKDTDKIAASLTAAQNDVSKIFQGYEVPAEYRARLTAYIQRWYLDQGQCENGVCLLRPVPEPMPDSGAAA